MNTPIRHGENLLLPVSEMPIGKTKAHKSYIVGHSETGHHHVLESTSKFDVFMDEANKALYLNLTESAQLTHLKTTDKHKTLTVPAGMYKVIHKTEYDPFLKVRRAVWD